jgi:hypothetical protein
MGVDIYSLQPGVRRHVLIGGATYEVGFIGRLWKVTETGLRPDRIDTVEALEDVQAARTAVTPPVMMVDGHYSFGEQREILAFMLLGWDSGRVRTQDYDWDHLPTLGWAVDTPEGGLVVHEEIEGQLLPMSRERATKLGILTPDGQLAEHRLPVIAECLSIESLGATFYAAECRLEDGRTVSVSGESESGELPDATWFAGRDTAAAAHYGLVDQLAGKPGPIE